MSAEDLLETDGRDTNGRDPDEPDSEGWAEAERDLLVAASVRLADELARARADRDRAVHALDRLQARRSLRAANAFDSGLLRGRRLAAAMKRRTIAWLPSRVAAVPAPPPRPSPAQFRRTFLEKLDRGALRVAIPVPAEGAAQWIDQAHRATVEAEAAGWEVRPMGPDVDAIVLFDPAADIHALPRGPVLLAVVADVRTWVEPARLADVDLVVVPDETVAHALEAGAGVRAAVVVDTPAEGAQPGSGQRVLPPNGLTRALRGWATGLRIGIAIGIPSWEMAESWGDLHFARGIQRQFERRGFATRIHLLHDWTDAVSARDDVAIHLFGLRVRPVHLGQRTVLWVISHPDRVSPAMLDAADRVYVASDLAADQFRSRTVRPVAALHQATDPDRFRVDRSGPQHQVLFVGNTRGVRRQIVEWLVPTTVDLAIYGLGWTAEFRESGIVRGDHIPNQDLNRWYGSAAVVLNDHWPDMRAAGLFSNRLYDALASGAFVISDAVAGMDGEFDGSIVQVKSAGQLRSAIRRYLDDPAARRELAERGRRAVLDRHTFAHRVDRILADLEADLGTTPPHSR